jgi:hypothetical protein
MQVKILRLQDERPVNEFLATGVNVSTKHVYLTKDGIPEVAIFYETALDDAAAKDRALIDQNAEMDRLIEIAREVAKDKIYNLLKNIAQRELFLFTQYNLSKADAGTVQTLLTPEMRPVLMGV